MQTINVYSIYDARAKLYTIPFFSENNETAKREFQVPINAEGMMGRYPEDYTLFCLGKYEFEGGVFDSEQTPTAVAQGVQMVEADQLPEPEAPQLPFQQHPNSNNFPLTNSPRPNGKG